MQRIARSVQRVVWQLEEAGAYCAHDTTQAESRPAPRGGACVRGVLLFQARCRSRPLGPEYTGDGQIKLPENYREWVYLTTDST